MKTYLDCVPCFFRQALESAKIVGADEKLQRRILNKIAELLPTLSLDMSPPEVARIIYKIIAKLTREKDPYSDIKNKSNKFALNIYPILKKKIQKSNDKLLTALELAIAGNIIDYGVKNKLNINKELDRILDTENNTIKNENKSVFEYNKFKKALTRAKYILYLADNAGETVFDKVLIEGIKRTDKNKNIIYAVKEKPIINDALEKDAKQCGIDKITKIVSSGSDAPGTVLSLCSKKFLKIFNEADLVISKGQGNFEALSDVKRPIFFLFIAKCPVIVKNVSFEIGKCKLGNIILYYNSGNKNQKTKNY